MDPNPCNLLMAPFRRCTDHAGSLESRKMSDFSLLIEEKEESPREEQLLGSPGDLVQNHLINAYELLVQSRIEMPGVMYTTLTAFTMGLLMGRYFRP